MSGETFGAALRRWREARQLSVRALAAKAHYGKSYVSDLENGRLVRLEVAERLDEVLDTNGVLVALARAEQRGARERQSTSGNQDPQGLVSYGDLAAQLLAGSKGWGDMQRRTFVLGVGGAAGLGLAAPALALETARHGLTLALAGHRADTAVDEWHEIAAEYGYSYMTAAPAELLESLIVDVLGIQYAIERHHDGQAVTRELRQVGALLAALVAMTVANLGQVRHAERWWRSARQIAEQSGYAETVAWVRGREVVRALYEDRPLALILPLIEAAETRTTGAPQRSLPELMGGKAQALALAGRRDEALSALDRLRDIHASVPGEEATDRVTIFSWAADRLHFTESFVYSHLGLVPEATRAQEQALAAYPASYRRGPAQIELQRALCQVRSNDVTGGVRHAQAVLAGLSPTEHIRPIFDLGRRVHAAVPIEQRPRGEVAELRECITALEMAP